MASGYFGKLPMRGDFVSRNCPAGFLVIWEPFLQEGLAAASSELKEAWEGAYMTMPVWKFVMRPVAGNCPMRTAVAGAFMPSVDRVGRKYPLAIVSELAGPPASASKPTEDWYEDVKDVLLFSLEETAELEEFQQRAGNLEDPKPAVAASEVLNNPVDFLSGDDARVLETEFWTDARGETYSFRFDGIPKADDFVRFVKPELFATHGSGMTAGDDHGQPREDLQT
ncbi:type VI secretion system-associated protein TagF [Labrenzia sp. R4_1]|uniref:type VI secretion system-associated protein TagF n=1 Tax=Labrenzia sp. R4_1 TaxID=2821106 RepID=UPI001ADCC5C0|nr:type VI secretion system-associated protein TagF [Labrenzia sp. R4_1]MBO9426504.1 type VI secretion system-associated protein TagF [Labrenzia sp. R4_1]